MRRKGTGAVGPGARDHAGGGKAVKYRGTAGYPARKDAKTGKTNADIVFVADTKLGTETGKVDPAKRVLMFSFNGGPGSASLWLHRGALGPKRVVTKANGDSLPPPDESAENDYAWLDETDLGLLEPGSTVYSRAATGEAPKQFYGFNEEVASVGDFIRLSTMRNRRWSSLKFLVGESDGTPRAAALSDDLQDRDGLYLNGMVLVCSIMNFATARCTQGNDLACPLARPTYPAGAW